MISTKPVFFAMVRQAVIYLRVSTVEQTTANQERELREIASRMGCEIVKVYKDHGISGAKGRNGRPAFDALCRAAARREFDVLMAWSVDRLGRSLQDLVGFLSDCTRSRSTSSCANRGSTPRRRPAKRCFR
jgi:DNA invertase Pin-like site-specific DNA recombinase